MDIVNPYADGQGGWLKGALHVHSTNSDGSDPPQEVIADHRRRGFDFVALTDHRVVPSSADVAEQEGIVVLPGCEYRGQADSELGVVGLVPDRPLPPGLSPRELVESAVATGAFVIYNHPNWHIHHWPIFRMLKIGQAHALEVYNAVVEGMPGPAEASDKWDRLLTAGVRIWGVATDDAHTPVHRDKAWVMVNAPKEAGAILAALKAGRFYATNGPTVASIRLEGTTLQIESPDAQAIRFFADRGTMRRQVIGGSASYEIRPEDIYVRAELYGQGPLKAWTQPLWVDTPRSRQLSQEFHDWYLAQQPRIAEW